MGLEVEIAGQTLVLAGDLDRHACQNLMATFATIDDSDLVVDMARVGYIDEAGLRVLVIEARRRTAHGNTLTIATPTVTVRRQLETRGLLEFFRIDSPRPADP